MSATVRSIFSTVERTVDRETGEEKSVKYSNTRKEPREPKYVKVYIENVGSIEGLAPTQKTLLYELILRLGYNGVIMLTAMERKKIIKNLGISEKTFRNNLTAIVKSGLIIRHSPSDYEANPHYFARGKWAEIMDQRKDFELRIRYRQDGEREITTEGLEPDE